MFVPDLNQNTPSCDPATNAEEQGASHPFFPLHGEGDHPYPSPWPFQSGNGQGGRPDHPYISSWAQSNNNNQGNKANEIGNTSASRKPYPVPGQAQQPHIPWHQPHAYFGPSDGRKPSPAPFDDDNHQPPHCKPYPYSGSADGHKPYGYPEAAPWGQFRSFPWGNIDHSKPPFSREPCVFQGGLYSAGPFPQQPSKNSGNSYDATPFPQHFGEPHASHGPWGFMQQTPWTRLPTRSDKYIPEVDVFNTAGAFVIHVPLPGAKREDIEVNWDSKRVELSITGLISRPGSEDLVKTIVLDERKGGTFERKVRLGSRANPPKVDADAISAKLEDGVLVVEVPKIESDDFEVKKVEVE
ncbi:HSP20-like chaperone [Penicillium concentricum]|uniref:HSP20-like chaperone n=1 Tax=Penicillium concentricum TaxID=293559 RepID=A0A9W9RT57_9EURO|nr:HSP20-like chaperone [Penicillium concentricum]KAJ5365781.1 HSP20-like chaperone [Penicillium concentricum]